MNWSKTKVLITGAGGFIGSHLTEELVNRGADVRAFVHYNSRGDPGLLRHLPPQTLAKIEIIAGDLRDSHALEKAVAGTDIVYHLGALISIPYSYKNPYEVAETNILGTLNVLLATRNQKTQKVIHTSTSEVYGTARKVPISESHPLQGQSPYSASKIAADKLAESFFCAYDLPVVTIRPFNTYGPRQSARAVIPAIISQALVRKQIRIGNQDTTRDFTYVTDTVSGFIKASEIEGVAGTTFNLGTGREIRIKDLVELIVEKINPAIEVMVDPNRLRPIKSEVYQLISDSSLSREVLGWRAIVELDRGIENTIEWIKNHLEDYSADQYVF